MSNEEKKQPNIFKEVAFILVCFICIILIILSIIFIFDSSFRNRFFSSKPSLNDSSSPSTSTSQSENKADAISFYFIDLENGKHGDSIYIKAGNNDILIDAGNSTSSFVTIEKVIDKYCLDKELEYVIATNSTNEHIASFYVPSEDAIFSHYKIDNLIDFGTDTGIVNGQVEYSSYVTGRNLIIQRDKTNYLTAQACLNNNQRIFSLGNKLEMEILPNTNYGKSDLTAKDYSVMVMFNQGDTNHFLFTGDVLKAEEDDLVTTYKTNYGKDLPTCQLYRATNYGDSTSTSSNLLKAISPTYCILTCSPGEANSTLPGSIYPSYSFINAIAKYTSKVYVPSGLSKGKAVQKMNGTISVHSASNLSITLDFENNDLALKDSEWFNRTNDLYTNNPNRTWPS